MDIISIIFFGTSRFSISALRMLANSPSCEVLCAITQPDKPAGRNRRLTPPPVKQEADALGIPLLQPLSLKQEHAVRADLSPYLEKVDLFVVAAYGKIMPPWILSIPPRGTLNIHPSLLPEYRGPSPIQAAILDGAESTGVSIMLLDEEMDHGPILAQERIALTGNETTPNLSQRLAEIGAQLLIKTIPDYCAGNIAPKEQEHARATFTKLIRKEDGKILWETHTADRIYRMWRAFQPWPEIFTTALSAHSPSKRIRVTITACKPASPLNIPLPPGEIAITPAKTILAGCANKTLLEITELQREGKKPMPSSEFIKGFSLKKFQ